MIITENSYLMINTAGEWEKMTQFFTLKQLLKCPRCGCVLDPNCISTPANFCPGCGEDKRGDGHGAD